MPHPGNLLFNGWLRFGMILNIMATCACKASSFSFRLFPFLTSTMSTASSWTKWIRHLLTIALKKLEKIQIWIYWNKEFFVLEWNSFPSQTTYSYSVKNGSTRNDVVYSMCYKEIGNWSVQTRKTLYSGKNVLMSTNEQLTNYFLIDHLYLKLVFRIWKYLRSVILFPKSFKIIYFCNILHDLAIDETLLDCLLLPNRYTTI